MTGQDTGISRRRFLKITAAGITGAVMMGIIGDISAEPISSLKVMTVTGEVKHESLGFVLPHEHVMVDFIGADKVDRSRYNPDEVFNTTLPYLKKAYEMGCRTLVECTPDFLGRDPVLMQRLSKASGLKILTNTGFYGAADDKFIPSFAIEATAKQLADRWTDEWEQGIEGTGIRPGFIKIGMDPDPSDLDMKLLEAAGLTHLRTGLSIASHTVTGRAAKKQIEKLISMGVHPAAFIWVHAHAEPDTSFHTWAAGQGAWLEYDGLSPQSLDQHVNLVKQMNEKGFIHRVMVSHDAGWYNVGEPGGGNFRGFETMFNEYFSALRKNGITEHKIRQITQTNPQKAFAIRTRRYRSLIKETIMASNAILSAQEIELCKEIGFDEKIASLVKKKSDAGIQRLIGYTEAGDSQPANGITIPVSEDDAYGIIEELWTELQGTGYIAFYSERYFGERPDMVGVIRSDDEFDILKIKQTNGWNYDISPDDIVEKIREWNMSYPLTILGADYDWVEILFDEVPSDINAFAAEVYEICPDAVDQGTETVEALAESISESGILFMWWD
ncbi:MAG: phosphotriesterase family protein [Armatimonadota bacterium]